MGTTALLSYVHLSCFRPLDSTKQPYGVPRISIPSVPSFPTVPRSRRTRSLCLAVEDDGGEQEQNQQQMGAVRSAVEERPTTLFSPLYHPAKRSPTGEKGPTSNKLRSININSFPVAMKVEASRNQQLAIAAFASVVEEGKGEWSRQNIPTKKQTADPFRQGQLTQGGIGYQQIVVIRSYEVGPDKTATLESILNLLQETALNHMWMSGLLGDGFGATHGMMKNNLIWVITRMHLQVDKYPIWGEVVDIETWGQASGKNGMQRDWVIQSHQTKQVFARATSTWVMMNRQTRRLSKIPEEVRDEISPWFTERKAIKAKVYEKIVKLDCSAKYVNSELKPNRSDLDMNHHVNNVKYVRWMLESMPDQFMENHQLCSITLEYRRECGSSDIVQSLCEPDHEILDGSDTIDLVSGFPSESEILGDREVPGCLDKWPTRYHHLLQIKGEYKDEEIVRGRTTWMKRSSVSSN